MDVLVKEKAELEKQLAATEKKIAVSLFPPLLRHSDGSADRRFRSDL